ncbi:MAG: hypothetical protein P8182_03545 [Deltaproteobacteria bacterium]
MVHSTIGRLRVRIPAKKRDSSYFSLIKESLADCPGIENIEVNPLTGSALVIHDTDPAPIADYAASNGLFRFKPWKGSRRTLFESVEEVLGKLNRRLKMVTGGEFDVPSLFFTVLLVSGLYQIARGNLAAPAWYTAFWYAFGIFSRDALRNIDQLGNDLDIPEAGEY